ncbi:MAG: hypothetical protein DRR19_11055, partial [Candidatus Parabeggiatoa sp. nov. 1]
PDKEAEQVVLSSLRHPQDSQSDVAFLLNTLGKLWLAGGAVDWSGFYAYERRHRLPLPTYPFERQRYWIDPPKYGINIPQVSLGKEPDITDEFYSPGWKISVPLTPLPVESIKLASLCWLVFVDACGLGIQLVKKLVQLEQEIITVRVGSEWTLLNDHDYILNPEKREEDYEALLEELRTINKIPHNIVHLWMVTPDDNEEPGLERLEKAQRLGFDSLLFLAQALGKQELTQEIQLMVVSNNMQTVTGEEMVCPEKTALLGPVKIIGQEYPNIHCRSIDVVINPSKMGIEQKLIESLLVELTTQTTDQVVAYRGKHRWVPTFDSVRLDNSIKRTSESKPLADNLEREDSSQRHSRPNLPTPYLAPRTPMEITLTNIWQKLLGIEQIGVCDDFFELGGDSLLGTQVISDVRKTCQVELPLQILFEKPTVAELAGCIEASRMTTAPELPLTTDILEEDENEERGRL